MDRERKIRLFFCGGIGVFSAVLVFAFFLFVLNIPRIQEESPVSSSQEEKKEKEEKNKPEKEKNDKSEPALEKKGKEDAVSAEEMSSLEKEKTGAEKKEKLERSGAEKREKKEKKLIFVIDDAGNNLQDLEPFLRFPGPITVAVLPGLAYSAESARRIRSAGKEVILHQPMEAIGGKDPGPGAVYTGMKAEEIRAVLEKNLAEIGPAAGMNNHQGSKVTMDGTAMETVLQVCREQGVYFLDSRTIAETAAPAAAERLGIKIAERDVFLDNVQEKAVMLKYLREGLEKADRQGVAVMIGHTWSPELAPLLAEAYADLTAQGYVFSTISALSLNE
ncbi:MAG: divergent polysaccharide deacetylase family protein [Spirochaetaceae bacterium]|jgi:polysaccharide deacetylase 2 family uncharacterized protein YibQ|nr:divergent polysaccharide deacetylase family protein [Spirochaetaceae bacterium]